MLTFDTPLEGDDDVEKTFTYQPSAAAAAVSSSPIKMDLGDELDATIIVPQQQLDSEYETSVESVLRELDIAIGGDASDEEDADDMSAAEASGVEGEKEHLENVLRQLFIDNMLSSLSSTVAQANERPAENNVIATVEIECNELGTSDRGFPADRRPENAVNDATIIGVGNDDAAATEQVEELATAVEKHQMQEVEVDEMNFFDDLPAICQSTPSVRCKRESVLTSDEGQAKPSLVFDDSDDGKGHRSVEQGEDTFVMPTRDAADDVVLPRVTVCQADDENIAEVTYEVKVARKDSNATITPVNTPIEINYGEAVDADRDAGEGEMTFTKDLDCFDERHIQPSTSQITSGWFLHPQGESPHPAGDETFDFDNLPPPPPPIDDATYYGEFLDDEEDAESDGELGGRATTDFDALRKQLADLLPHAQGAPAFDEEGAVGG